MTSARRVLYLDQNAWIALAQGAWDAGAYPTQYATLTRIVEALKAGRLVMPLSFTNIYETAKINDAQRRSHLASVQSTMSNGKVFRGRWRILEETLLRHLAARLSLDCDSAEGSDADRLRKLLIFRE